MDAAELGWAIGDDRDGPEGERDSEDAEALYSILEQEVVPEFYARDTAGIPRQWLERVRRSMAGLAPTYSSSRMAREYVEQYYLARAAELRRRTSNRGQPAQAMRCWELRLRRHWSDIYIGEKTVRRDGTNWCFFVPVELGGIAPTDVAVQLYAEPRDGKASFIRELSNTLSTGHSFTGSAPANRPIDDYTIRIIPRHAGAVVPTELPLILWQK